MGLTPHRLNGAFPPIKDCKIFLGGERVSMDLEHGSRAFPAELPDGGTFVMVAALSVGKSRGL